MKTLSNIFEALVKGNVKNTKNTLVKEISFATLKTLSEKMREPLVIYIEKRKMNSDPLNPYTMTEEIYVLKYGRSSMGKEWGQDKYDWDSLDGQDLDGDWSGENNRWSLQDNVLTYFQKISHIDCCHKVNKARESWYEVRFGETDIFINEVEKISNKIKIFRCF